MSRTIKSHPPYKLEPENHRTSTAYKGRRQNPLPGVWKITFFLVDHHLALCVTMLKPFLLLDSLYVQAFKQNTGRDIAEFWKRTLSFVRDDALTFLSIFVVGFSSSFQCASSQANPSANNE